MSFCFVTFNHLFRIIQLPFEKAYCLYRLNNLAEACKILKDVPEPGLREKELLAQVVSFVILLFLLKANKLFARCFLYAVNH